ncbi:MAG: zinc transporter ZntB [Alphaproteobacteria bacterium]|nr:zinc transporter ZntB [Alphaproteobacteria bacterium]
MPHECVINAYRFDRKGGAVDLPPEEIVSGLADEDLVWIHLDAANPHTGEWLTKYMSELDTLTQSAMLEVETRPRINIEGDSALVILRGVNLNENAEAEDMISIRIWITGRTIISTRIRKLRAVQDMREKLEEGTGPKTSGDFLTMLATRLFQRMDPVITELDEETDALEESIMEHPDTSKRHAIVDMRRKTIELRRYIAPQKDVLAALRLSELSFISDHNRRQLQENHDRVMRYVEELDAVRERAQIIKDELGNALSDAMNKNMYVLSVIAAIFLPLGFLTGLLGINVGGIPGADNEYAFWIFVGMLTALVVLQIALFKKLKWF